MTSPLFRVWTVFIVYVIAHVDGDCSLPVRPQHGTLNMIDPNTGRLVQEVSTRSRIGEGQLPVVPEGTIAVYTCRNHQTFDLVCQGGLWAGEEAYCPAPAIPECPEPNALENGSYNVTSRTLRSRVEYSCNHGYTLTGRSFLICRNGHPPRWKTRRPPRCVRNENHTCARPPAVANGAIYPLEGDTFKPGQALNITCDDYYYPQWGDTAPVCLTNGSWSDALPQCIDVICFNPSHVDYGHWTPSVNRPEDYDYRLGDEMTLTCDEGYHLQGPQKITCTEDDWFPVNTPKCIKVQCPQPGRLENGRQTGNSFLPGDILDFTCSSGYRLLGSSSRTCQPNRRWSGYVPTCERVDGATDCPTPVVPDGGSKEGSSYNVGDVVKFSCNSGHVRFGPGNRTCLPNGLWSGDDVLCEAPLQFTSPKDAAHKFQSQVDKLSQETITSKNSQETGARGRSMGTALNHEGGLDVYLVFDNSGSITDAQLKKHFEFATYLVDQFGVDRTARAGGTIFGAMVFQGDKQIVLFNAPELATTDEIKEALQFKRDNSRHGTNINLALLHVGDMIELTKAAENTKHRINSHSAIFLFSDGIHNQGGEPDEAVRKLWDEYEVEIFAITVTQQEKSKELLAKIVSTPQSEHLYFIETYDLFERVLKKMKTEPIDYTPCGWAGDTNLHAAAARTIGGSQARDGAWPWMAGFYKYRDSAKEHKLVCGSSLIDEQWVVTAAHCLKDINTDPGKEPFIIAGTVYNPTGDVGGKRPLGNNQKLAVDKILRHKDYNPDTKPEFDNDIALLHLKKPAILQKNVQKICLPGPDEEELFFGGGEKHFGVVTGWGHTKRHNDEPDLIIEYTKQLQQVEVPLQSNQTCLGSLSNKTLPEFNYQTTFCAGSGVQDEENNITDACSGDSGGPLVVGVTNDTTRHTRYYLAGVVSFGFGCGQPGRYGFYTKIPTFIPWIQSVMDNFTDTYATKKAYILDVGT